MAAARALGALRYRPAAARFREIVLRKEVRNAEISERIAFFEGYGMIGDPEAVTILDRLLQVPEEQTRDLDLSSLRALVCGAAPLFPSIKRAVIERFGPVLYEFYGATETGVNTGVFTGTVATTLPVSSSIRASSSPGSSASS